VEALLKQHGLEEGKAVAGEELALSSLSPEEVLKRLGLGFGLGVRVRVVS